MKRREESWRNSLSSRWVVDNNSGLTDHVTRGVHHVTLKVDHVTLGVHHDLGSESCD